MICISCKQNGRWVKIRSRDGVTLNTEEKSKQLAVLWYFREKWAFLMIVNIFLKQSSEIDSKKMKKNFWGNFEQFYWMGVAMVSYENWKTNTMYHEIFSSV